MPLVILCSLDQSSISTIDMQQLVLIASAPGVRFLLFSTASTQNINKNNHDDDTNYMLHLVSASGTILVCVRALFVFILFTVL